MTGTRVDPFRGFNFSVSLTDSTSALSIAVSLSSSPPVGSFSECSGLEMQLDIEEYREGGRNGEVLQFPTRVKWGRITLKKGLGYTSELWDWHYGFAQGKGKRRDGVVVLTDNNHIPAQSWYFKRGLPVRYAAPPLNASQNAVAIESIEIAHEGILQFSAVGAVLDAASGLVGGF